MCGTLPEQIFSCTIILRSLKKGVTYHPCFTYFFGYWFSAKDYVGEYEVYKIRLFWNFSQAAKTDYSRVHQKKSPVFDAAIITDCFESCKHLLFIYTKSTLLIVICGCRIKKPKYRGYVIYPFKLERVITCCSHMNDSAYIIWLFSSLSVAGYNPCVLRRQFVI
jgi:hypothetical protein